MKRLLTLGLLAATLAGCQPKQNQEPIEQVIGTAFENAQAQALLLAKKYEPQEGRLPQSWRGTVGDGAAGEDVGSSSRWWCSGFFPGTLWYLYENSGDAEVLRYAQMFTERVEREKYTTTNHDVGFMLMSSFGNGLRLTPVEADKEHYREVLSTGARSLATRFRPSVGLIRSWDHNRAVWQYPVIIDNMMNLELMFWAADYTGDENLRTIALSHADSTLVNHFREDYGSYHVVSYDTLTGNPLLKQTHQGYADESNWARGQAWALYGYTMMYRITKQERYLTQAQNVARFVLGHKNMPADYIPYWDFDAPEIPNALRDASAAAIMASALIELADYSQPSLAREYMKVAETQIRTLASPAYTAPVGENGDFILMHSVGAFPLDSEIDVPLTYADYYYVEALTRLSRKLGS